MRVAVVTSAIRPGGGPAGYVHNWETGVRSLGDAANHAYTFDGRRSQERALALPTGIPEHGLRHRAGRAANLSTRGSVRQIRERLEWRSEGNTRIRRQIEHSDAVVIQGFQPVRVARFARKAGRLVIYMPHSPTPTGQERAMLKRADGARHPEWETRQFLEMEAELIATADCVVFPSPGAAAAYLEPFRRQRGLLDRVKFIPSGVPDPEQALEPTVVRRDPDTVLFVGRFVTDKGPDLFSEAASHVLQARPSVRMVALGSGPHPPSPPVEVLPWSTEPHEIMRQAGLIVVPNRVAYYDLLPLEAAGLGLPLVMTPCGGNVDQAAALPDSILASDVDPKAVADAVMSALDRLAREPRWGAANREAYTQSFTLSAFAERWDKAISAIAAGHLDHWPT